MLGLRLLAGRVFLFFPEREREKKKRGSSEVCHVVIMAQHCRGVVVYCSTTVELSVSGHVWHHATSGTRQSPTQGVAHTHTFKNTQIQFPLINNVFVVHASSVFATCQLYLT